MRCHLSHRHPAVLQKIQDLETKNMPNQININELVQKAKASADGESYFVLHRGKGFRIGVGARMTSPNTPSFFVEAIIALADESKEVDLQRFREGFRYAENA